MNTQEEIMKIIQQHRDTQFVGWPLQGQEQVHEVSNDRFALHSGGREELS